MAIIYQLGQLLSSAFLANRLNVKSVRIALHASFAKKDISLLMVLARPVSLDVRPVSTRLPVPIALTECSLIKTPLSVQHAHKDVILVSRAQSVDLASLVSTFKVKMVFPQTNVAVVSPHAYNVNTVVIIVLFVQ